MGDLKNIKKHYGEAMMHLCRELFPTLIEKGILFDLLSSKFDYSKFLYDDIISQNKILDFKNLINSLVDKEDEYEVIVDKTPKELLSEAGYNLYECKTEEDIQKFKKYYSKGEELCTFDGDRLKSCYVFFAVKKNVNEIKRKNFKKPFRQDLYGTSVISIQFSRGENNTLSIKNRYNHRVNNPDATFSNNLENIKEGLTQAFSTTYNLNIKSNNNSNFELDNYVLASDSKYYRYNLENFNIYYCSNNIIIDNFEVKRYDKEKYIVFDYFILDMSKKDKSNNNKKIIQYDDGFFDTFIDSIGKISKVDIKLDKEYKKIIINDKIVITLNKYNQMIKYKNEVVKVLDRCFLQKDKHLEELIIPNVELIKDNCLCDNACLKRIYSPNLEIIEPYFLNKNECLRKFDAPNLKEIKGFFLIYNKIIRELNVPNLEYIGPYFLVNSSKLEELYLPNTKIIKDNFMNFSKNLKKLDAPILEEIGSCFLSDSLTSISIFKGILKESNFEINVPKLKKEYYKNLASGIRKKLEKNKILTLK